MRLHLWGPVIVTLVACSTLSPIANIADPIKPGEGTTETDATPAAETDDTEEDTEVVWETGDQVDGETDTQDTEDTNDTQPPAAVCGNNTIETGEVCDGNQFGGETCISQGFDAGFLVCAPGCTSFDTSNCTNNAAGRDPLVDVCEDTCPGGFASWIGDLACDDGGPGSSFSVCPYGSDCSDCGPRPNTTPGCLDVCPQAENGVCNDGGSGSVSSDCLLGDDCFDCGPR